jgi:hypothetical protein
MDRIKEAAAIIIDINKYRVGELNDYNLIKSVCYYYDSIKDEALSDADLRFLKYISNSVGIPHYFDLLRKFEHKTDINNYDLNTLSSLLYESTLIISPDNKVHKYQKNILDSFLPGNLNRYFLSASTSFGKTFIVFEIIKKMQYKNVVLIFPTIALLSENLERLTSDDNYKYFLDFYSIHTLSDVENIDENNLFIYTPERFLSFIEKSGNKIMFNFAFIDEVYKIDNDYIIDEEVRENERDVAYRLAVFYSLKKDVDVLLAGPYIDFLKPNNSKYNRSFDRFLEKNKINLINFNNYEIVNKYFSDIKTKNNYKIDEHLNLIFKTKDKTTRLYGIIKALLDIDENSIVYCFSRKSVESYAKKIIQSGILANHDSTEYTDFIEHIAKNFNSKWTLVDALKNGIGIHHGLVPKYIQKEIVSLFNRRLLHVLISTTTITEGVNTSAKNLIVLHSKKGIKQLKKFDAQNIAGRAGRFLYHYSGRVIVLQNEFMKAIQAEAEGIKHKNYDLEAPKDEIDLYYTDIEYLSENDKLRVSEIRKAQLERNIPDFVFSLYKVVSRLDKIKVYDQIKLLTTSELESIKSLIRQINIRMRIDYDGFQTILNILIPIVKNQKLKFLIEYKGGNGQHSILTSLVHYYLVDGFIGSIRFKLAQGDSIDSAISETAEFVYNILKYQVVKYLGVFNVMYKLVLSEDNKIPFEQANGLDKLLTKLEYNALTEHGRIASDFGVPSSIVDYYEDNINAEQIKASFDSYESLIFEKVEKLINRSK